MKDITNPLYAALLRQKAEEILKSRNVKFNSDKIDVETFKLIHELDVHQVELEMQNEELVLAKKRAEEDAEKYANLYDFAPSGYLTLSKEGEIIELNFSSANILGKERSLLLRNRFGFFVSDGTRKIFNEFIDTLLNSKTKENCELVLNVNPDTPIYVYLTGIASFDDEQCLITMVDISKRKKAEEELNKSNSLLESTIESQKDIIIFSIDNNYRYLNFNKAHSDVMKTAYNSEIKIGQNILDCISSEEDKKIAKENYDRALKGESHSNIRLYGFNKKAYYESFFNPIINNNEIIGATGLAKNINKRIETENKLLTSEEKYRSLFENNLDSIIISSVGNDPSILKGNIVKVNKAASELYGYTSEEMLLMSFKDLDKVTKKVTRDRDKEFLEKGKLSFETIAKTKKGNKRNIETESFLIEYDGEPAIMNISRDITERKQNAENARKVLENLATLLDAFPDILFEVGFDGRIYHCQAPDKKLLAFPLEQFMGKLFQEVLPPDVSEICLAAIQEAQEKGRSTGKQYMLELDHGKSWFEISVSPIKESPETDKRFIFIARDITDRKLAQEALLESEEKYRGLVENSPDAIVIYVDDKIVFINEEGLRITGTKNNDKIIGKSILDFIHPNSKASVIQIIKDAMLNNKASAAVEEQFIDLKGSTIDAEIKTIPIIYENKSAVQIIIHDITQRKKASIELNKINRVYALISQINNLILRAHDREELFQEICNIAVTSGKYRMSWIGILDEDNKTIKTAASAGFKEGYFTNANGIKIDDTPQGKGPTGTAMREGRTVVCNDIINDPKMTPWKKNAIDLGYNSSISIPILVRNKIIGSFNLYSGEINTFSSQEEIELLEKITQNLSFTLESILFEEDRKVTQEKIQQLSQAVEQSPVTIIITNTSGTIEYANPKFTEVTGYTFDEIIGQNPRILNSGHTLLSEYKNLWQTISNGNEWHGEFHNKKKNGELYWESASISPIINAQGKTTHYIAIKEDITDKKNIEKELLEAKEHAEESDRLKLVFLANMSHEIRTPMNGILGFTELLKEPKLSGEEQQEYINIIEKSGKRMLNIINDIISISKVESGQVEISLSETNVNDQIDYLNTFFKPEAAQKGLQLKVAKQLAAKDSIVSTDKEKIYAILTNLVKNALKFTDSGSIEFGCVKKDNTLEFFVKDTGSGISVSQQQLIFERFRQANETLTRTHEGSGLGLAISKAYVEMLGGKIWVESEVGKGSTFFFTIPFMDGYESEEKNTAAKEYSTINLENKIKDLKVLIVEDDVISKLLITIAVKPYTKEILKVSTGYEAIETCRNNPDIDLVMMDINMPEMGGYEATKQIREFNKDIIIIAQTANGMQSDRDDAIASGCTDYISKPVNIAALSVLIQKYFNK